MPYIDRCTLVKEFYLFPGLWQCITVTTCSQPLTAHHNHRGIWACDLLICSPMFYHSVIISQWPLYTLNAAHVQQWDFPLLWNNTFTIFYIYSTYSTYICLSSLIHALCSLVSIILCFRPDVASIKGQYVVLCKTYHHEQNVTWPFLSKFLSLTIPHVNVVSFIIDLVMTW